jgi:metal-responsive CopG/Arc/MetJ family transcriptional regulator
MSTNNIRTTLELPADLLEAADRAVSEGKASNRDELVANALRHELATLERTAIDAEFADMANDNEYHKEARQIMAEFAKADWEVFQKVEQEYAGDDEK